MLCLGEQLSSKPGHFQSEREYYLRLCWDTIVNLENPEEAGIDDHLIALCNEDLLHLAAFV